MLKKLLKYDIKYVYKVLIVFYILSLFFAILTRLVGTINDTSITKIIYAILNGITISMMFSIIFNTIMRLWSRLAINFYKDEAYLTHTLPVDKKTLFKSKYLSCIITLFISMVIITLTIFIAYYSKENMSILRNTLLVVGNAYQINMTKLIVFILVVCFLEVLSVISSGYIGLILGHRRNDKRIVYSILFGFIIYISFQVLVLIGIYILGLFNSGVMSIFTSNNIISAKSLNIILYFSSFIYMVINYVLYLFSIKTFNKGVNIE